jgi:hypothetical protein
MQARNLLAPLALLDPLLGVLLAELPDEPLLDPQPAASKAMALIAPTAVTIRRTVTSSARGGPRPP